MAPVFISNRILNLGGSTSISLIFTEKMNQAFAEKNKKEEIEYFSVGSSGGLRNVVYEQYEVGFMSKEFSITEDKYKDYQKILKTKNEELKVFQLAKDGIIFIYHLPSTCKFDQELNLTIVLLQKIYKKRIAHWSDLNIENCSKKIIRINREHGSGTRSVFEKKIINKTSSTTYYDDQIEPKTEQILRDVSKTEGALAYISFSYKERIEKEKNPNIKIAKLDGKEATLANIKNNNYTFSRPFVGLYLAKNKKHLESFFNFMKSSDAKKIIEDAGFIHDYKQTYTIENN